MRHNACAFDQNIDAWQDKNLEYLTDMSRYTSVCNQPLNSWQMTPIADISSMFKNAVVFNQNINSWQTKNVANSAGILAGASIHDQGYGFVRLIAALPGQRSGRATKPRKHQNRHV